MEQAPPVVAKVEWHPGLRPLSYRQTLETEMKCRPVCHGGCARTGLRRCHFIAGHAPPFGQIDVYACKPDLLSAGDEFCGAGRTDRRIDDNDHFAFLDFCWTASPKASDGLGFRVAVGSTTFEEP